MSITIKQLKLSGIARESDVAFQAATAASECVRFYDVSSSNGGTFDVEGDGSETALASPVCFEDTADSSGTRASGEEQRYEWEWEGSDDGSSVCSVASLYKFYDEDTDVDMDVVIPGASCPEDTECTVVYARGYNAGCSALSTSEVVERELTIRY